jgi:hypothetical protein
MRVSASTTAKMVAALWHCHRPVRPRDLQGFFRERSRDALFGQHREHLVGARPEPRLHRLAFENAIQRPPAVADTERRQSNGSGRLCPLPGGGRYEPIDASRALPESLHDSIRTRADYSSVTAIGSIPITSTANSQNAPER